jgi:hypothetical protein
MSSAAKKFIKLLKELKSATENGKVSWSETMDENEFRVVLGPGMVRIGRHEALDEEDQSYLHYSAKLLNRDANIVEELRGMDEQGLIADLFELARRSARGSERLLDDMLADVESRLVQSS